MTQKKPEEIHAELIAPFPAEAISWRAGATDAKRNNGKATKCIALAYIDARDVMNRLDEVFGFNWKATYSHADNKTICELSVLVGDHWITRANGAGDSDIEAEKGAISDAFKRAAVMFGIGRYLYELPNVWVPCDEWKKIIQPPDLPKWALPSPFSKERLEMMNQAKISAIDAFEAGNVKEAHDSIYGLDNNEEILEVWGWLKPFSTLRNKVKKYREELMKLQQQKEAA